MKGCDFENKSFNVNPPGTKAYAAAHDRIFRCSHGNLKSSCPRKPCVAKRAADAEQRKPTVAAVTCYVCHGKGEFVESGASWECGKCDGKGVLPCGR